MSDSNQTNVLTAFDRLLKEIDAELERTRSLISRAAENADYEQAKLAADRAHQMAQHRGQVDELRRRWSQLSSSAGEAGHETERTDQPKKRKRLRRGARTPEEAYVFPILRALAKFGGSAKSSDVLETVGEFMRDILRPVDHEPIASDPRRPRWRNSAEWARNTMVEKGLLRNDSPRGVWELTEEGWRALREGARDVRRS